MTLAPLLIAIAAATQPTPQPAATPTPEAAPPQVSAAAQASTEEVEVGEAFEVVVTLSAPEGTRWTLPEQAGDEAVPLERLPRDPERQPPDPPGTHRYRARAFAVDEAAVPPIEVGYRLSDGREGTLATEAIPLRIRSLLPKGPDEQKLADIRPPRPLAIGASFWAALGLAATLLAVVGVLLWRRWRRPAPAPPPPPPTPADVEALAALDRLGAADHAARAAWREYYIELALIAKRYLERRLHAPVLEMTTAEASLFLRDHPDGQAVFPALRELASAADQVKFARADSRQEEARRHLEAARGLVRQLEERLRPAPPPPAREPGMAARRAGRSEP